jgi:hypothetical protein
MRIPDPIANTTTEAYLAYKAGVLAEGDLKPKLYDPYIHLDAWLAYWAGLTTTYPNKGTGKNLLDASATPWVATIAYAEDGTTNYWANYYGIRAYQPVIGGQTYTLSSSISNILRVCYYDSSKTFLSSETVSKTFTTPSECAFVRWSEYATSEPQNTQLELGSEATDYEPYKIIPEMLTDEEALIAYLSGVTDTYPEEFRDPADVRVAAYLKYLVSYRWGRPEYPVTNEELYLSMMDAPYIPAGEPSSDIEIDNTAEAPFRDVKMYGDTSQTTYTGKNLFNLVTPDTNNGVTVTANADGSFTVNGKTTGVAVFNFILPELKPAGTYTISCTSKNQVMDDGFFVRARKQDMSMLVPGSVDGPSQIRGTGSNYVEKTFVSTDPMYCLALNLTTTGVTYNNMIIYPQVEAGSTATSYEPYVGGVPAPNPDYPQAVNTVTGRQVVKVEGKNLAKVVDGVYEKNGITVVVSDGRITVDGTATANAYIPLATQADYYTLSLDGTYTFSGTQETGLSYAVYYDASSILFSTSSKQTKNLSGVYSNVRLQLTILAGSSFANETVEPMLEKGSTATEFTPYQSGEYEINLGKNLAIPFASDSKNGMDMTVDENGIITLDGTASAVTSFAVELPSVLPKGRARTMSMRVISGTTGGGGVRWRIRDTNGVYQNNPDTAEMYLNSSSSGLLEKVVHNELAAMNIVLLSGSTCSNYKIALQLEEGETATSYAPYFTPIELCKIGDYQDYIYENEGKWYVHKETNKKVFTGAEQWFRSGRTTASVFVASLDVLSLTIKNDTKNQSLMDYFRYVPAVSMKIGTFDLYNGSASVEYIALALDATSVPDATAVKAWVEANHPAICYILTTPTDTEITNTALIDQLNALKKGGSYTGTTYIKVSATDPNLPGLLEVEAYKYD